MFWRLESKSVGNGVRENLILLPLSVAGQTRTTESIVEEAQGKLTELEQRIKEAIEKNAQLKNIEMMQVQMLLNYSCAVCSVMCDVMSCDF